MVLAAAARGQSQAAPARFRTAWGDPDLQGIWSSATLTPLERPDTVDQEYLTESQAKELNRNGVEHVLDPTHFDLGASGESNEVWLELGEAVRSRRTSLVVDPPNGRVPYTPEGPDTRALPRSRRCRGADSSGAAAGLIASRGRVMIPAPRSNRPRCQSSAGRAAAGVPAA
jgi:hypothetical protein